MDEEDRYTRITLRIPKELHGSLSQSAEKTSKSLNAEIIERLQSSYDATNHDLSSVVARLERHLAHEEYQRYADVLLLRMTLTAVLHLLEGRKDDEVLPGFIVDISVSTLRKFSADYLDKTADFLDEFDQTLGRLESTHHALKRLLPSGLSPRESLMAAFRSAAERTASSAASRKASRKP